MYSIEAKYSQNTVVSQIEGFTIILLELDSPP